MTLAEFKAWLDGFKEAVGDAPTRDQWQKVLAKLQDVTPEYRTNIGDLIGPYLRQPSIPDMPYLPYGPAVTCGGTSAGLPGWLKGATLSNLSQLDATATEAIFSNIESLYEN